MREPGPVRGELRRGFAPPQQRPAVGGVERSRVWQPGLSPSCRSFSARVEYLSSTDLLQSAYLEHTSRSRSSGAPCDGNRAAGGHVSPARCSRTAWANA